MHYFSKMTKESDSKYSLNIKYSNFLTYSPISKSFPRKICSTAVFPSLVRFSARTIAVNFGIACYAVNKRVISLKFNFSPQPSFSCALVVLLFKSLWLVVFCFEIYDNELHKDNLCHVIVSANSQTQLPAYLQISNTVSESIVIFVKSALFRKFLFELCHTVQQHSCLYAQLIFIWFVVCFPRWPLQTPRSIHWTLCTRRQLQQASH